MDLLSLGATKGGALAAEAVVVFTPGLAPDLDRHRKRNGHLLSKQRFVSAQFLGWLQDGAWLRHADHANAMAARLGQGLAEAGPGGAPPGGHQHGLPRPRCRADTALKQWGRCTTRSRWRTAGWRPAS
ncbi:MAG: hypothetical protein MZU95_07370 [Desulfomicrobium escambiense]|nr:hypothetical protein [Desulfomicrobium escambiense]